MNHVETTQAWPIDLLDSSTLGGGGGGYGGVGECPSDGNNADARSVAETTRSRPSDQRITKELSFTAQWHNQSSVPATTAAVMMNAAPTALAAARRPPRRPGARCGPAPRAPRVSSNSVLEGVDSRLRYQMENTPSSKHLQAKISSLSTDYDPMGKHFDSYTEYRGLKTSGGGDSVSASGIGRDASTRPVHLPGGDAPAAPSGGWPTTPFHHHHHQQQQQQMSWPHGDFDHYACAYDSQNMSMETAAVVTSEEMEAENGALEEEPRTAVSDWPRRYLRAHYPLRNELDNLLGTLKNTVDEVLVAASELIPSELCELQLLASGPTPLTLLSPSSLSNCCCALGGTCGGACCYGGPCVTAAAAGFLDDGDCAAAAMTAQLMALIAETALALARIPTRVEMSRAGLDPWTVGADEEEGMGTDAAGMRRGVHPPTLPTDHPHFVPEYRAYLDRIRLPGSWHSSLQQMEGAVGRSIQFSSGDEGREDGGAGGENLRECETEEERSASEVVTRGAAAVVAALEAEGGTQPAAEPRSCSSDEGVGASDCDVTSNGAAPRHASDTVTLFPRGSTRGLAPTSSMHAPPTPSTASHAPTSDKQTHRSQGESRWSWQAPLSSDNESAVLVSPSSDTEDAVEMDVLVTSASSPRTQTNDRSTQSRVKVLVNLDELTQRSCWDSNICTIEQRKGTTTEKAEATKSYSRREESSSSADAERRRGGGGGGRRFGGGGGRTGRRGRRWRANSANSDASEAAPPGHRRSPRASRRPRRFVPNAPRASSASSRCSPDPVTTTVSSAAVPRRRPRTPALEARALRVRVVAAAAGAAGDRKRRGGGWIRESWIRRPNAAHHRGPRYRSSDEENTGRILAAEGEEGEEEESEDEEEDMEMGGGDGRRSSTCGSYVLEGDVRDIVSPSSSDEMPDSAAALLARRKTIRRSRIGHKHHKRSPVPPPPPPPPPSTPPQRRHPSRLSVRRSVHQGSALGSRKISTTFVHPNAVKEERAGGECSKAGSAAGSGSARVPLLPFLTAPGTDSEDSASESSSLASAHGATVAPTIITPQEEMSTSLRSTGKSKKKEQSRKNEEIHRGKYS